MHLDIGCSLNDSWENWQSRLSTCMWLADPCFSLESLKMANIMCITKCWVIRQTHQCQHISSKVRNLSNSFTFNHFYLPLFDAVILAEKNGHHYTGAFVLPNEPIGASKLSEFEVPLDGKLYFLSALRKKPPRLTHNETQQLKKALGWYSSLNWHVNGLNHCVQQPSAG